MHTIKKVRTPQGLPGLSDAAKVSFHRTYKERADWDNSANDEVSTCPSLRLDHTVYSLFGFRLA